MVLKRRSQGDSEELIEVKVMAMNDDRRPHDDHLMVQIRLSLFLRWQQYRAMPQHSRNRPTCQQNLKASRSKWELDTELRRLVSRSGLILGTSCSNTSDPMPAQEHLRGQTVQRLYSGRAWWEVAQLVPLVHVVAQAAVVG